MATTVAKVALDVVPDLTHFGKELANGVSRAAPDAVRAGEDAGQKTGHGFGRGVSDTADKGLKGLKGKVKGQFADMAKVAVGAFAIDKVGDFIGESVRGWQDHQRILRQTAQVISSTGSAAKLTAGQMDDLASSIENNTGADGDNVLEGENLLATFTNIHDAAGKGNDIFSQTTKMMNDLSVATGTSMKGAALQLGKALNDPVKGMTALSRVGVSFTAQQKAMNKALVDGGEVNALNAMGYDVTSKSLKDIAKRYGGDMTKAIGSYTKEMSASQKKHFEYLTTGGHVAEAQKNILKELGKEFGGSAKAQETSGQKMQVSLRSLQDAIGQGLTPIIDKLASFLADTVIPIFTSMVTWLEKNGDVVKYVAMALAPLLAAWATYAAVTKIVAVAQGILNAVMEANPIILVVTAIAALAAGLYIAYQKSETFRHIVQAAFQGVKTVVLAVVNWFRNDFIGFFTKTIPHAFTTMVNWIKTAFHHVVDFMKTWGPVALAVIAPFIGIPLLIWQHFGAIKGFLGRVFSDAYNTVKGWIGDIVGVVTGLPGKIADLAGSMLHAGEHLLGALWDGITNALSGAGSFVANLGTTVVDGIIDAINNGLNLPWDVHIHIPLPVVDDIDWTGTLLPRIPRLATGGMTRDITAAIVGDNPSGSEAILPLDSPHTITALAGALREAGAGAAMGSHSGGGTISGELRISADSSGRLRAWVQDVVLAEGHHVASLSRMRVGA
jgi:hypothetical protein